MSVDHLTVTSAGRDGAFVGSAYSEKIMNQPQVMIRQDDIERGERYSSTSCPMALALKRQFDFVSVSPSRVFIKNGEDYYECVDETSVARLFVVMFDTNKLPKHEDGKYVLPSLSFTQITKIDTQAMVDEYLSQVHDELVD